MPPTSSRDPIPQHKRKNPDGKIASPAYPLSFFAVFFALALSVATDHPSSS
jgi:hypothetical protein